MFVADFGLAKILGEFQSTKTLCGTPMYVAPEMLAHSRFLQGDKTVAPEAKEGYGIEVDAWSLGCILYIILSGRPPFNDPIPKDLFERIAAGQYELTEDPWPRISSEGYSLVPSFPPSLLPSFICLPFTYPSLLPPLFLLFIFSQRINFETLGGGARKAINCSWCS